MGLPATLRHQVEKFLHFIVMGDEMWDNNAAKKHDVEKSTISTGTAIRNKDQGTFLLEPRRRDSCGFP